MLPSSPGEVPKRTQRGDGDAQTHITGVPADYFMRSEALPSHKPRPCSNPKVHPIFVTLQDENLGENVISVFLAGERVRRKNEPIFHSSLPKLSHLYVNFLLSQKLSKPFA